MTTGAIMFLLDAALALLVWPLVMAFALPARLSLISLSGGGWEAALLFPAATLLFLYALGLYRRDAIIDTGKALGRLPIAVALAGLASVAIGKLLPRLIANWPDPADGTLLFTAAIISFIGCGVGARMLFASLRRHRVMRPNLLVVGAGARAWDLAFMLHKEGRNLAYDITFMHDPAFGPLDPRLAADAAVTVVIASGTILQEAQRIGASDIVVAPDERRGMALEQLLDCKAAGFMVEQYLSFVEREIRRVDLKRMELSWIVYSDGFQVSGLDRALKRLLDIVVSLLILLPASPFMLLAMLAVALDDGLPIFYRQTRMTLGGRPFQILKLRTMRRDAEAAGAVWAAAGDARITRVGTFLRRTRLDELRNCSTCCAATCRWSGRARNGRNSSPNSQPKSRSITSATCSRPG